MMLTACDPDFFTGSGAVVEGIFRCLYGEKEACLFWSDSAGTSIVLEKCVLYIVGIG